jgi:2-octaprenyl-6-methoxyphenol hydroxylase
MNYNKIEKVKIIGGSYSGLITAISLSKLNIKSHIIEKNDISKMHQNDVRGLALNANTVKYLDNLGLWTDISEYAGAIEQIRVVDSDSPLFLHFDNELVDNEILGYIVSADKLFKVLYNHAKIDGNIVITDCATQSITNDSDLLIGCDGKNSIVRKMALIDIKQYNYKQTAMVFNIEHENNHNNIALEKFTSSGPFAVLPLKNGFSSSIVWTEKANLAKTYLSMSDDLFIEHLQSKIGDYLGKVKISGKILSHPLSLSYVEKYYKDNMVLVGNAAHNIHPISGQGLNMAILDIKLLSELIVDVFNINDLLQQYENKRLADNYRMICFTHNLNNLFISNSKVITNARRVGLGIVNQLPSFKKYFMQYAMGKR